MSKLMSVLGIILLAVGLALGLLEIVNPGQVQSLGVTLDTAVTMLVGGILSIGLGGVIAALERGVFGAPMDEQFDETPAEAEQEPATEEAVEEPAHEEPAEPKPSRIRFPGFGRKAAATTAAAAATAAAAEASDTSSTSVQDTIEALEQAKQDIKGALGGMESATDSVSDEDAPAAEEPAEGELYVIEEKTIRGRPARILSDNTVEAETDDGWMRFENLEHLNEYLDAAGE